ncbi:MAG: hypothetical protein HQM09_11845 [Candidatus Riflebacteria bacterium]|nr:hypothetical protein [Candidatus Riflebacteria bacterium]
MKPLEYLHALIENYNENIFQISMKAMGGRKKSFRTIDMGVGTSAAATISAGSGAGIILVMPARNMAPQEQLKAVQK